MMDVYEGHVYAQLCLISCCSSFWVDTIYCTDLEPNLTLIENGQKTFIFVNIYVGK